MLTRVIGDKNIIRYDYNTNVSLTIKTTQSSSKRKENKCGGYIFPRLQGEIMVLA